MFKYIQQVMMDFVLDCINTCVLSRPDVDCASISMTYFLLRKLFLLCIGRLYYRLLLAKLKCDGVFRRRRWHGEYECLWTPLIMF